MTKREDIPEGGVVMVKSTLDPFAHRVMTIGGFVTATIDEEREVEQLPQLLVDIMLVYCALAQDTGLLEEDQHKMMIECREAVREGQEEANARLREMQLKAMPVKGSA